MDRCYYFYILLVISEVYDSFFFCKENLFFFFLILISDFFYKDQVILIVIKICDLNRADLNRPTLSTRPSIYLSLIPCSTISIPGYHCILALLIPLIVPIQADRLRLEPFAIHCLFIGCCSGASGL